MSKSKEINSLAKLKKRQQELNLEMKVSQQELVHSMGASRDNLQEFLLKKVALPAGGAILGLYLLHRALNPSGSAPSSTSGAEKEQMQAGAAAGASKGVKSNIVSSRPTPSHTRIASPSAKVRKKAGFDFGKIVSLGKIVVPAAQAIMLAINESKGQPK